MLQDASFRFFPATAPLSSFVDYHYFSHVPPGFANHIDAFRLPELEAQLVFAIEEGNDFPGGYWLSSGERACLFFQPGHLQMIPIPGTIREAVGASLRPAGLRILMPSGSGNFLDTPRIALEDLWGAEARALLERLVAEVGAEQRCAVLRDYLRERVQRAAPPSRTVTRAVELIRASYGEISTEQLARSCGCTSRTLRSAALAETGLAPKHLARVARIRHALHLLTATGVALSDAAVAAAFSDQAHMSREFRELIGAAPSALSRRLRSSLPTFTAERNLMSTGLLVLPKAGNP
jgi:methylphosphotriester-DNA--protein-cysteine methyltransferase